MRLLVPYEDPVAIRRLCLFLLVSQGFRVQGSGFRVSGLGAQDTSLGIETGHLRASSDCNSGLNPKP